MATVTEPGPIGHLESCSGPASPHLRELVERLQFGHVHSPFYLSDLWQNLKSWNENLVDDEDAFGRTDPLLPQRIDLYIAVTRDLRRGGDCRVGLGPI
jgi:hypothetical protein